MPRSVSAGLVFAIVTISLHLAAGQSGGDVPQPKFSVVHAFQGGADGAYPGYGAMIVDPSGNLYGATLFGGQNDNGTIFARVK